MNLFKAWIEKQSILDKLIYSNLLAIAFAFIPIVFVMTTYEYFSLRKAVLEEVRIQATIIAESSSAALAFHDNTAALETLATLRGSHDFIEAHLILADGSCFESYYAKGVEHKRVVMNAMGSEEERIYATRIVINKPIYLRSELVGSLVLVSGLESFYKRLAWYVTIMFAITSFGFLLARFVATRISKTITEPLSMLTEVTQKMMQSQDYTMSMPTIQNPEDEVGSLSNAFSEMMSQIRQRDFSLQQLADYDRVTGIANRHYFEERIEQAVGNAQRYGTACYLLMIDLDDFKVVNDTLGHDVGDQLLRYVSRSLELTMRQNDSIFRIGGDEFAIIIESPSSSESVGQIAQKIIKAISTPTMLDGHNVKVGASIGISCFPRFSKDVRMLVTTADTAMYAAKKSGKNSYRVYNGNL